MEHKPITIQPTPVEALTPGDIFRDGGQNFRITGLERDEEVVEVTYYIGVGDLVNSFYLSPDDTLDLVIETQEWTATQMTTAPATSTPCTSNTTTPAGVH